MIKYILLSIIIVMVVMDIYLLYKLFTKVQDIVNLIERLK